MTWYLSRDPIPLSPASEEKSSFSLSLGEREGSRPLLKGEKQPSPQRV